MMDERESKWAARIIEQAKRDHKTILALREQLARARTERDEARQQTRAQIDAWDVAMRAEFARELAKVQAELEQVRKERDGLAIAPLWCPPEPDTPLAAALRERDEARDALDTANAALDAALDDADILRVMLKRYTDVYGDPDAPVDLSSFAGGEPDAPPLFPELAAMADRILAGAVPDGVCVGKEMHDGTPLGMAVMRRQWDRAEMSAPHIKVGARVRCEALGNLTGLVETVNPSEVPGWDQCFVRDDREGHVWVAAAWILEVLP